MSDAVLRGQIFGLRLNRAQRQYMACAAGTARFAYNWALAEWKRQAKEWWDSGKATSYPTAFNLQRQFNEIRRRDLPWTFDVVAAASASAILQVGKAVENYRAGDARYPKFKSRDGKRSFVACARRSELRIEDGARVVLPKIGSIRLIGRLRWPDAEPRYATITERAGRWYVAISFELPEPPPRAPAETYAGVDLGITSPLTVSSGDVVLHIGGDLKQRLNVERRKLRRANKTLHRRVKGSGRRWRAKQRVARIHQRMSNIRADMQHKATHLIAGMASCVGLETLAVRNMMRNGRLARSIADVGFYEIRRQLNYKADQVVEADRFYPSSKTCSACGSIKQDLTLSDRTFRCECGHEVDRDVNAARNLERMAANCAVSARGAGSSARKRKLSLSSLAAKREAQTIVHNGVRRQRFGGQP